MSDDDAALDQMERWTIVEHLLGGYYDFKDSDLPEEQRQEGLENLAQLLDKLSPNWRDADSCREIETYEVIISNRGEHGG
ncbi:hypothetical protein [Halomicrococcus sp. NG-SE-24]|uniref:hypothetical protein n=1 Tax=Halomicrococcus sp. NG-SE-24 TaxID=3436928 RepID=UPI003D989331